MSRLTKGYIIEIIGVTIWSMSAIFIRFLIGSNRIPPLQLAQWRDIFLCGSLALALALVRPALLGMHWEYWKFFIVIGLAAGLMDATWVLSVKYNGAAAATVLAYGSTAFTALLGHSLYQEKLGWSKIAAVILSLGGCFLVAEAYDPHAWTMNSFGIVIGLISGLTFAGYSLLGKGAIRRGINSWNSIFYSFLLGTVFITAVNFIPILPDSLSSKTLLPPLLPFEGWLGLFALSSCTLLGNGLYIASMVYLPVSVANLLASLEPAITILEAYLILGERLTLVQLGGSLLVVAAVIILCLFPEESRVEVGKTAVAGNNG